MDYGDNIMAGLVAPHTGAWIETWYIKNGIDIVSVAPHTGAWIETCKGGFYS